MYCKIQVTVAESTYVTISRHDLFFQDRMPRTLPPVASALDQPSLCGPVARLGRQSVACVMSPALGDTLILLVVAHNLWRAGWRVHVYGDHAHSLAAWFQYLTVSPALKPDEADTVLQDYAVVLQLHRDRPLMNLASRHPGFIDLHDVEYAKSALPMAQRCAEFTKIHFGLASAVASNGIKAPKHLTFRRHDARVAMHPEASTDDKRWLAPRFVELSRRLKSQGLNAEFVVAPNERARWNRLRHEMPPLRSFTSTAALAEWLYESGWFIGNDSGVGHLASSLGVPTLTVFRRRRIAERWRPGFAAGSIVLPPWWLPTAKLKERWWRESITVGRVFGAFKALVERTRASQAPLNRTTRCSLNGR